jgi:hypothetical protein
MKVLSFPNSQETPMIKLGTIAVFAAAVSTSALAQNAVVTQFTQCNEAQLKQAQNAVDSIKDPDKQSAAQAELKAAVASLQSNDPTTCLAHLTNASKFVTP